jgi:pyridoxal phosphate enzyme (YggS family)
MSGEMTLGGEAGRRLEAVRERIRRAAERAGRDPATVTLIAVSKTMPASAVRDMAGAGQRVFGENRIQEAKDKIPEVDAAGDGTPLTWRLVGHLQRNKVKPALDVFHHLDSIDSFRLLEAVSEEAGRRGRRVPVLLQFNCSGEETKGGFGPSECSRVAEAIAVHEGVTVEGLMTIGPLAPDPEAARPAFRRLRELREELEAASGRPLPQLSMGMSGDLEVGIAEGATLVRVGTALFGPRG